MARTDADSVKAVLAPGGDYDLTNAPSLTPFINAASIMVDRVATCASDKGVTLTDDELLQIETWLAAHRYCQSDKTYQSKSTQGASGQFTGVTGKGIESTLYGQTALELDYSGCLNAIAKRQTVGMISLGYHADETDPADDT